MNEARWNNIKQVFSAALERPAAERAAFVEAACAGDAELKREVEGLLAKRTVGGAAEGLVRTGGAGEALEAAAAVPPTVSDQRLLEGPGTRNGPYKLLELIGEGGFGSVFMAEQDQPVRRRVALKIIKPGMDSRMVAARFEAERQALALMEHPHIARVFDGGITDAAQGARPYFVMEYVKGDPINAFADAHRLALKDRLTLFIQVCEAVQHAHTKGIIHRDLKPSNVLVSMVDGRPFAKVIDFGIAKATGQRLTDKTLFTEHRQLIGTPEYMSPEQAEGSPDIDTRTDVYGLGVLLYELLTGLTPFDSARLRSAAYAEMQRIIKEEEPIRPSLRLERRLSSGPLPLGGRDGVGLAHTPSAVEACTPEPQTLPRLLRGELDWIVMKALDKDRARRYESASQLAADVERHLTGEAVVAAPAGVGYRLRKFVRRNKGPVIAGAALMASILLGGGLATWGFVRAHRLNIELLEREHIVTNGLHFFIEAMDPRRKIHARFGPPPNNELSVIGRREELTAMIEFGKTALEDRRKAFTELETANTQLREAVKQARLAESTILLAPFVADRRPPWYLCSNCSLPATPDALDTLRSIVTTREELVGSNDPLTIEALFVLGEWTLADSPDVGLNTLRDAAQRSKAAHIPVNNQLLKLQGRAAKSFEWFMQLDDAASVYEALSNEMIVLSAHGNKKTSEQLGDIFYVDPWDMGGPLQVGLFYETWPETSEEASERLLAYKGEQLKDKAIKWINDLSSELIWGAGNEEDKPRRYIELVTTSQRILATAPEELYSHILLARAYYLLGKYPQALEAAKQTEQLRRLPSTEYEPENLAILAMTYFKLGQSQAASEYLNKLRIAVTAAERPHTTNGDLVAEAEALIDPGAASHTP